MVVYVAPEDPPQVDFPIPSFSLGITQLHIPDSPPVYPITNDRNATPEPKAPENIRKTKAVVDTLMPSGDAARPIGDDMNRIYKWVTDRRGAKNLTLAWIRNGSDDVQLQRANLQSLGWRRRVSDTVVDYCCAMFNTSSNARFYTDFYCIPPRLMAIILTDDNIERCAGMNTGFVPVLSRFIGRGQHWFDVRKAKKVDYWFVPVCRDDHWWLYVLHRKTDNLWVLDSMHSGPHSECRDKIDKYVLASTVDPNIVFTAEGYECCYETRLQKQPNGWDCGIYVIKWMEMWDPKSLAEDELNMPIWNTISELQQIRKEIVTDILLCKDNISRSEINGVLNVPCRHLEDRGKKKNLEDPWTNPRTRSLVRRAERDKKVK
ncbi:hypothetical protein HN873_036575 [Arachis hypogaea]